MGNTKIKRCLFITNHFFPEFFRGNEMVAALVERGYEVTVLTNIPNYPQGRYYDNYSLLHRRTETVYGAKVIRTPVIPRGKGSKIRLVIEYISGCLSLWFYAVCIALFNKKYDVVIVQQLSPVYVGWAAMAYKQIRKVPIISWILDLWPESLVVSGITNESILKIVSKQSLRIYSHSDKLLVSSKRMIDRLTERGISTSCIGYLPNWFEDISERSYDGSLPDMPNGFKVMFAGNMGEGQNLDKVIAIIKTLPSDIKINWIFVGDGRRKNHIKKLVEENHIDNIVTFVDRMPVEAMPILFAEADVMLVSLSNIIGSNDTLPAKVQAYMANSKPILCIANGESQQIINDAQCGWCIGADDITHAVSVIADMYNTPIQQRVIMGQNGSIYFKKYFTKATCMSKLLSEVEDLTHN